MNWVLLQQILGSTALVCLLAVLALWLLSIPLRDVSIIDIGFAPLISTLVLIAWLSSEARGFNATLILTLVLIWGLRMSLYLLWRNWGRGEDPRYTRLRSWVAPGRAFYLLSLRQVFLLQGVVIWVLILPQQIALASAGTTGPGLLSLLGLALWLIGFLFESIGDYQLSRFKADAANKGKVLNTGLWRYTRHPNYFGELSQWWGLFLIAAEAPWAWCGIVGPLVYSYLVINVTGKRTLDKKMAREKPEYAAYIENTNGLIPGPPRA